MLRCSPLFTFLLYFQKIVACNSPVLGKWSNHFLCFRSKMMLCTFGLISKKYEIARFTSHPSQLFEKYLIGQKSSLGLVINHQSSRIALFIITVASYCTQIQYLLKEAVSKASPLRANCTRSLSGLSCIVFLARVLKVSYLDNNAFVNYDTHNTSRQILNTLQQGYLNE